MFTFSLDPILHLSDEQFYQLAANNPDIKLERCANGDLDLMSPTGGETGRVNLNLAVQLWLWNQQNQLGEVFDSSTGFHLPNGSDRSPDVAWVSKERWSALSVEEQEKFLPLCPDFALEILSPSDSLAKTQAKMLEYRDNGCRLGWLIDRKQNQVTIYRPGLSPELQVAPTTLSGDPVLPGFILDLTQVWR
jgi:Uma2 family endonuclease